LRLLPAFFRNKQAQPPANLRARWNISEPTYAYNRLAFVLDYQVNDFIDDSMAAFSVWDSGCQEGGVDVEGTGLTGYIEGDDTPPGIGLGTRSIKVNINVHTPQVESTPIFHDTTPTYPPEQNITAFREATVSFCVRFSLNTPGDYPNEVNFHETLIDLAMDFSNGFAIESVAAAPEAGTTQAEGNNYTLSAYECSTADSESNQGSVISICIEPSTEALGDGVRMRSVDSFTFFLEENGVQTVTQEAVKDGAESLNGLTRLFCVRGQRVCTIETILNALFYASNGTVDGYGVANMQFGSRSEEEEGRRLGSPSVAVSETRTLQEDSAGSSDIYVQFQIDGSPPISSSWWFVGLDEGSIAPADEAIYILFILCVFSLTLLFMQQPRFKESKFYL
jgi:hypothetical protein